MRPDPEEFVRAMLPPMRKAASIARMLEGRVENHPKRGEASDAKAALTLADSAVQEALLVPLFESFPEVMLGAEEQTRSVPLFPENGEARVVIDPIDGTLHSYLEARGPYGVMMGMAVGGRYEAALVSLPREQIFVEAVRGKGAWWAEADEERRPARVSNSGRRVMVSYQAPGAVLGRLAERGLEACAGCGGAISVAPLLPGFCAGLRIATNSEGISERGRVGVLISEEGGALSGWEGAGPFPSHLDEAARALLVAGDAAVLEDLRYALSAADLG